MRTRRLTAAALAVVAIPTALAMAAQGDVTRMSVKNDGSQSATGGFRGVTSGSGRYVAFNSAENLTGTDTGGKVQVFVRDRVAGTTRLASATGGGTAANDNIDFGDPFNPFIDLSADGRYVVFASAATNLVDGDTNAKKDVFRKDMQTGEIIRLSVTGSGDQGNDDSTDPSVSGDGTRTVFRTAATNILPGLTTFGVALRDTVTGTTTLVSSNSAGVQANDFAERPTISADGGTAAFEAGPTTTNLYPNDTNATNDIIVKNLATGAAVPASVKVGATVAEGANVLGGNMPDVSGTGRYVVFETDGALDAANDTNAQKDVYRRDVQTGTTTLVSARNGLDAAGSLASAIGAISADGERAAFSSAATNLIATDANAANDVFARTFATKGTVRLSERADGTAAAQGSETSGISGNGAIGVFTGQGAFAADDTNGATDDVYAKELTPTDTTAPTPTLTGSSAELTGTVAADPSGIASVRVDGRLVRPAADGTFRLTGPFSGNIVSAEATDGAGNAGSTSIDLTPKGPVVCCTPPFIKPRILSLRLVRKGVRVTISSSVKGTARLSIGRVVTKRGKTTYPRVGKVRSVSIKAGRTTITLQRPKKRGSYRVVASARVSNATTVLTKRFKIR